MLHATDHSAIDESEIETTEFIRPDAADEADAITDHRAGLAATWLVAATRAIEAATDDLNAAIRAGARLPMFVADRVVLDAGNGGFLVVTAAEFRRMTRGGGR